VADSPRSDTDVGSMQFVQFESRETLLQNGGYEACVPEVVEQKRCSFLLVRCFCSCCKVGMAFERFPTHQSLSGQTNAG
jgi:hypothetical protein